MNCSEFTKIIYKKLDGVLSQSQSEAFDEHLAACPTCAQQYEQAVNLNALLIDTMSEIEVPDGFAASVMDALPEDLYIEQNSEKVIPLTKKVPVKRGFKPWALVACAAAVAVFAGVFSIDGQNVTTLPNDINIAQHGTSEPGNKPVIDDENEPAPDVTDNTPKDEKQNESLDSTRDHTNQKPLKTADKTQDTNSFGVVDTPKVAYNTQLSGQFNITVLAQHENTSALAPHIKVNGNIEYLLKTDDGYELWQQSLTASSSPIMLESDASSVTRGLSNTSVMSWLEGRDYVTDISDDNSIFAANIKGADGGLWVSSNNPDSEPRIISTKGGGSCLSISPDSSKIAFTDSSGKLYIAYLAEDTILEVFSGNVSYLEWLAESRTLVFSAIPNDGKYSNIYRATIP
ncbi:MAG: zf-HC2 domain-containing protein [Bacillota bacterium]|jgi:hypothetical protein